MSANPFEEYLCEVRGDMARFSEESMSQDMVVTKTVLEKAKKNVMAVNLAALTCSPPQNGRITLSGVVHRTYGSQAWVLSFFSLPIEHGIFDRALWWCACKARAGAPCSHALTLLLATAGHLLYPQDGPPYLHKKKKHKNNPALQQFAAIKEQSLTWTQRIPLMTCREKNYRPDVRRTDVQGKKKAQRYEIQKAPARRRGAGARAAKRNTTSWSNVLKKLDAAAARLSAMEWSEDIKKKLPLIDKLWEDVLPSTAAPQVSANAMSTVSAVAAAGSASAADIRKANEPVREAADVTKPAQAIQPVESTAVAESSQAAQEETLSALEASSAASLQQSTPDANNSVPQAISIENTSTVADRGEVVREVASHCSGCQENSHNVTLRPCTGCQRLFCRRCCEPNTRCASFCTKRRRRYVNSDVAAALGRRRLS